MSLIQSSQKPAEVALAYRPTARETVPGILPESRPPAPSERPPETISDREPSVARTPRKRVADLPLTFVVSVIWALHRLWLVLPPRAGRSRSATDSNRPRR